MGQADLSRRTTAGCCCTAPLGERLVNHYSFYAAFRTAEDYRLVDRRPHARLAARRLPHLPGTLLIFSGRRWRVLQVESQAAGDRTAPRAGWPAAGFPGAGGEVADEVRRRMCRVYLSTPCRPISTAPRNACSPRAARRSARLQLADRPIFAWGRDTLLLPWRGDRIMNTLAVVLASQGLGSARTASR